MDSFADYADFRRLSFYLRTSVSSAGETLKSDRILPEYAFFSKQFPVLPKSTQALRNAEDRWIHPQITQIFADSFILHFRLRTSVSSADRLFSPGEEASREGVLMLVLFGKELANFV